MFWKWWLLSEPSWAELTVGEESAWGVMIVFWEEESKREEAE